MTPNVKHRMLLHSTKVSWELIYNHFSGRSALNVNGQGFEVLRIRSPLHNSLFGTSILEIIEFNHLSRKKQRLCKKFDPHFSDHKGVVGRIWWKASKHGWFLPFFSGLDMTWPWLGCYEYLPCKNYTRVSHGFFGEQSGGMNATAHASFQAFKVKLRLAEVALREATTFLCHSWLWPGWFTIKNWVFPP